MSHWFHRNPLKATAPNDFSDLSKISTARQSTQIIGALRSARAELLALINQPTSDPEKVTEAFHKYLSLLLGFSIAPDSEGGNESKLRYALKFKWSNSLTGKEPVVRSDIEFEIGSIMMNTGIWFTKKANNLCTKEEITEQDALVVYKSLKTAAGIFQHIREKRADKLLTPVDVKCHDLDCGVLQAYEMQSLAEAQEVTIARAINLKHKPGIIAGLAYETAAYFRDAAQALAALETNNPQKVSKWLKYLDLKDNIYQAYAHCFYGRHLLDEDKCGDAIRCLKESQQIFTKSATTLGKAYAATHGPGTTAQPWKHPFFIRVSKELDSTLAKCEGENTLIYHHKIPDTVPKMEVKASYGLAVATAFEMPALHELWTADAYKCFDLSKNTATEKEKKEKKKKDEVEDKKELDPVPEPDIPTGSSCVIS